MKPKFYVFSLVVMSLFFVNSANAFTGLTIVAPGMTNLIKDPNPLSSITAKQFLDLTPKKFQEITGKKLNLVQKMQLKMLQYKVKRMVKKGQVVTMDDVRKKFEDISTMNLLGFLLGLILGPVGVVIALILKETGDVGSDVVRWSLYGLLIWLAIVLVVLIL